MNDPTPLSVLYKQSPIESDPTSSPVSSSGLSGCSVINMSSFTFAVSFKYHFEVDLLDQLLIEIGLEEISKSVIFSSVLLIMEWIETNNPYQEWVGERKKYLAIDLLSRVAEKCELNSVLLEKTLVACCIDLICTISKNGTLVNKLKPVETNHQSTQTSPPREQDNCCLPFWV